MLSSAGGRPPWLARCPPSDNHEDTVGQLNKPMAVPRWWTPEPVGPVWVTLASDKQQGAKDAACLRMDGRNHHQADSAGQDGDAAAAAASDSASGSPVQLPDGLRYFLYSLNDFKKMYTGGGSAAEPRC